MEFCSLCTQYMTFLALRLRMGTPVTLSEPRERLRSKAEQIGEETFDWTTFDTISLELYVTHTSKTHSTYTRLTTFGYSDQGKLEVHILRRFQRPER